MRTCGSAHTPTPIDSRLGRGSVLTPNPRPMHVAVATASSARMGPGRSAAPGRTGLQPNATPWASTKTTVRLHSKVCYPDMSLNRNRKRRREVKKNLTNFCYYCLTSAFYFLASAERAQAPRGVAAMCLRRSVGFNMPCALVQIWQRCGATTLREGACGITWVPQSGSPLLETSTMVCMKKFKKK